jgi:hypothetical protein
MSMPWNAISNRVVVDLLDHHLKRLNNIHNQMQLLIHAFFEMAIESMVTELSSGIEESWGDEMTSSPARLG